MTWDLFGICRGLHVPALHFGDFHQPPLGEQANADLAGLVRVLPDHGLPVVGENLDHAAIDKDAQVDVLPVVQFQRGLGFAHLQNF